ncbi:MAG: uracil-DNA glycosylase family protein [Prevotella sp.]
MQQPQTSSIERHPFEPFLPEGCRLLMLGSFPPAPRRWCMPFYYPNFMNDMWRIFGIVFFGDALHFVDEPNRTFRLPLLEAFLRQAGVGLYDTATAVIRRKNTAADIDLEVVEATDLAALLRRIPQCVAVAVTGQKATEVFCSCFGIDKSPAVGSSVEFRLDGRELKLYRMPSTSRAYPMKAVRKAEFYRTMFKEILNQP